MNNLFTNLETTNFILKIPEPGDAQLLYDGLVDTIEELRKFPNSWPWAVDDPSLEKASAFCFGAYSKCLRLYKFSFLILDKKNNNLVGVLEAKRSNPRENIYEIILWITKPYQNKRGLRTKGVLLEIRDFFAQWLKTSDFDIVLKFAVESNNKPVLSSMKKMGFEWSHQEYVEEKDATFDIFFYNLATSL